MRDWGCGGSSIEITTYQAIKTHYPLLFKTEVLKTLLKKSVCMVEDLPWGRLLSTEKSLSVFCLHV